jgi:uncharacterized protein (DUF1499 family)
MNLRPCAHKPNCVSSVPEEAPARRVDALAFTDTPAAAGARLRRAVRAMARGRIVADQGAYLRAEFHSRLFGFVDDLELVVDEAAGIVHVRSAARTGYWDLGVNRRRVEALRRAFQRP